jgi:hypothetical protein
MSAHALRAFSSWLVLLALGCAAAGGSAAPRAAPTTPSATDAVAAPAAGALAADSMATPTLRVLFVGNSLTYFNDMPALFQRLVERHHPGARVEVKMIAAGGKSLADHRRTGEALAELAGGRWTHVVLQDRSSGDSWRLDGALYYPAPEPFVEQLEFFTRAAAAGGAKPVLFQLWGRRELFPFVEYAYALAAQRTGSALAPIGRAWWALEGAVAGKPLVGEDGLHPSLRGSALIALTLEEVVFASMRRGTAPPTAAALPAATPPTSDSLLAELSAAELAQLAAAAARAVREAAATELPARPTYRDPPTVRAAKPASARELAGSWRARVGGPRLTAATELTVSERAGAPEVPEVPEVRVTAYRPSERVDLPVTDVQLADGVLSLRAGAGADQITLSLALDGGELRGYRLHAQRDGSRRDYRSVRFTRTSSARDAASFRALQRLYQARDRDERARGLAPALRAHYDKLRALLGEAGLAEVLEGFQLDEWAEITTAWLHAERDPARAVAYLRAAVELHPTSVDAQLQLAESLAAAAPDAARAAYLRAKQLDAAKPGGATPDVVQAIDDALRQLPTAP